MSKTVLVALENQETYKQFISCLEREESTTELEVSQNIENQASLFYFLPKIRPDAVIVSHLLVGDLSLEEVEAKIRSLAPGVQLHLFRDNPDEIAASLLAKPDVLKKVVAVWSPSGGVGKTEIAKNIALTACEKYKVILLDANLCNPDIAHHLGIGYRKGHTLTKALELWNEQKLNAVSVRKALLPYNNLQVLVGSEDAIEQTDFTPGFFRDLLKVLAQQADFVVVDMDSDITSPAGVSILLASDHIVTPFTTMPTALYHGKIYMDLLTESYKMDPAKFDPLLNREGEGGDVSAQDIEICVNRSVLATIPYEKEYLRASCKGEPLVLGKRSFSKKMARVYRTIVDQYAYKDVIR